MKHTTAKVTADMLNKIETIEKEVMDLKLSVLKKLTPSGQKAISLKGILEGVKVTEQDIKSAKNFLYSKTKALKRFMNFVSDTHALIWWFSNSPKISSKTSEIF